MSPDRGEMLGTGAALLLHVGLVVALTTSLASVAPKPEAPAMEVEVVNSDEIALRAAAPTPSAPPPATSPAPSEPQPAQPAAASPLPTPLAPALPSPSAAPQPTPARPQPQPRTSRLGDDFLKGLPDAPAKPAAATFNAEAKASVDQAIKRQIQPCADRQPALGPGAERIRVVLNLRLSKSGRLLQPPTVVRTSGVDDDNSRFEQPVTDQAIAVYRACSPLRLPPELYSTPQGGWGNINLTYRVP